MIAGRMLLSTLARTRLTTLVKPQLLRQRQDLNLFLLACKLSSYNVTKNIEHMTHDDQIKTSNLAVQNFNNRENRPLLVLLSWLLSKRSHVMKYANVYLEQGFDIVFVSITPWQLMWPTKGSRVVAADLLKFLKDQNYQQILLHGFSVGGYIWGEVLEVIQSDREKYGYVSDRIVGQIWDSAVNVTELSIGTPRAVFPKNQMLQSMLQKYLDYHLKTFHKQSTQYYIRASQLFHESAIRSPALLLVSKIDVLGTATNNLRLKEQWETLGIKTYIKIFEKSSHVGHYRKYPKEYIAELYTFLNKLNLIQNEEKMRARL